MQRLLNAAGEARERRPIRPAQSHAVPRLEATAANQVWTWDITKLALHERGAWLYLYVLIDLFSRYRGGLDDCKHREQRARLPLRGDLCGNAPDTCRQLDCAPGSRRTNDERVRATSMRC